MRVYKCPICGAVKNRKGEFFIVDTPAPLAKMRMKYHITYAHKIDANKVEIEIVEK